MSLQQSAQTTQALGLVGATVVVNGTTAQLANGQATWSLNATQPATATITITAPSGQTVYTGTGAVNSGSQTFVWNGIGNDGTRMAGRQLYAHGHRDLRQRPVDPDHHPGGGTSHRRSISRKRRRR